MDCKDELKKTTDILVSSDTLKYSHRITDRVRRHRAMYRDILTGLYTEDVFDLFLESEISKVKNFAIATFALVFIDVDNLSYINSCYGFHAGDLVIKSIGKVIAENVREFDVVARLHGGLFGIIIKDIKLVYAEKIVDLILRKIRNLKIIFNNVVFHVSASAGISICDHDSVQFRDTAYFKDLLKFQAEYMLKETKQNLKGVYISAMQHADKLHGIDSYNIIQHAIYTNSIVPYFQKIVDLNNMSMFGVEVLSRVSYDGKILEPNYFIHSATKTGLISQLDLITAEKAFEIISNNPYLDESVKVFINISAKTFYSKDFFLDVIQLVKKFNMRNRVFLEVTEHDPLILMSNLEDVRDDLSYYGISFVLDDFGSKYSSFETLKLLNPPILKIDGGFIKKMRDCNEDFIIVSGIVSIAKKMNIKVVAEFIEDQDLLGILREIGIDYGQGYLFGKPTADLTAVMQNG